MKIKKLKDFFFENYVKQVGFTTENSYYSMKHQKKDVLVLLGTNLIKRIPDANDIKEYNNSYLKNKALVKQLEIITQKTKHYWHQSIAREDPKVYRKLSKTIRQAKKVSKVKKLKA